jgi:hypothetical protein
MTGRVVRSFPNVVLLICEMIFLMIPGSVAVGSDGVNRIGLTIIKAKPERFAIPVARRRMTCACVVRTVSTVLGPDKKIYVYSESLVSTTVSTTLLAVLLLLVVASSRVMGGDP